jgi:hypothetical protein
MDSGLLGSAKTSSCLSLKYHFRSPTFVAITVLPEAKYSPIFVGKPESAEIPNLLGLTKIKQFYQVK